MANTEVSRLVLLISILINQLGICFVMNCLVVGSCTDNHQDANLKSE